MFQKSKGKFVMFYVSQFSCLAQGSLLGVFEHFLEGFWTTFGRLWPPLGALERALGSFG
jgi:membrane-bound metal-dependent hydrolase YbcI (DUF457 family)